MNTVEEWFEWRNEMRAKHRTMTIHEYQRWCKTGDAISDPRSNDCFPGGLTIILNAPPEEGIIGTTT